MIDVSKLTVPQRRRMEAVRVLSQISHMLEYRCTLKLCNVAASPDLELTVSYGGRSATVRFAAVRTVYHWGGLGSVNVPQGSAYAIPRAFLTYIKDGTSPQPTRGQS